MIGTNSDYRKTPRINIYEAGNLLVDFIQFV